MSKKSRNFFRSFLIFILCIFSVIYLYPFIFVILNSFKTLEQITENIIVAPVKISFENFVDVWKLMNYPRLILNTLFVTFIGITGVLLFGSMAGYKLSRTKGFLSWILFILIIAPMMIPFHSFMISLVKTARVMHLTRSLPGLGVIYWGLGVPLAVFMYHGFVKTIPKSIDECAQIDGASPLRIFFQIIFPLLTPVTTSLLIINGIWMWNDFLLPLLIIGGDRNLFTLQLAAYSLIDRNMHEWNFVMAWILLTMIPAAVFYFMLQKHIVRGIVAGTVRKI